MREADMKCKVNLSRFPSLALELTALRISGQSSESPRHGLQRQGNEVKSRPNEKKSNTRKLGRLKGGGSQEKQVNSQKKQVDKENWQRNIIRSTINCTRIQLES
jgi:hypothetical protein